MKNQILSLVSFLGCFLLFTGCGSKETKVQSKIQYHTKRLSVDRNYVEVNARPLDSLELIQSTFILQQHKGKIYMNDWNEQQIQEYTSDLKMVRTYAGSGRGPNEFRSLIQFGFKGNSLFGIDSDRLIIKEFELGATDAKRQIRFDDLLLRKAVPLSNDLFLASGPSKTIKFGFFVVSAASGEIVKEINPELNKTMNKIKHPGMGYDGNFAVDPNSGKIAYYCYSYNHMYIFNADGSFNLEITTIDNTPIPVVLEDGNITAYQNGQRSSMASVSIYNGKIYVLSRAPDKRTKGNRAIDVYDLDSGKYEKSFLMPYSDDGGRPKAIVRNDQGIYILYDEFGVIRFEINESTK